MENNPLKLWIQMKIFLHWDHLKLRKRHYKGFSHSGRGIIKACQKGPFLAKFGDKIQTFNNRNGTKLVPNLPRQVCVPIMIIYNGSCIYNKSI